MRTAATNRGIYLKAGGTVECGLSCRAVLIAKHGRRGARLVRKLPRKRVPRFGNPTTLRLPHRSIERLGPGRVRMVVKIDGQRMARRTVLLD